MSVPDELHEHDVHELNEQLYAAYNRIKALKKRIIELETIVEECCNDHD
jgi:hypothetical protein